MTAQSPGGPPRLPAIQRRQHKKSRIVGDVPLEAPVESGESGGGEAHPPERAQEGDDPVVVLVELNTKFPGGLGAVTAGFEQLWQRFVADATQPSGTPGAGPFPPRRIARNLYQVVLTRVALDRLLSLDAAARAQMAPLVIFRIWPDYPMHAHIDRSASTVKADAAHRSFDASGTGVVWAVIDTGIDARHQHFSALELAREGIAGADLDATTRGLHRDFSKLVRPDQPDAAALDSPLTDEEGHGSHVAGIIAGACPPFPPGQPPHVAASDEALDGGFVTRRHGTLQGMAPHCELVSIKVFRRVGGVAVTSSSAVIAALEYILIEVNVSKSELRIHGVNLSLGCEWDPSHYAAGQSPLCQLINELVGTGVLVVVSAGNNGQGLAGPKQALGVLASITEPAHAEACIAVGSTHRDAPHVFGISWTSSKGPTLDGRAKPDVVAPGEWICSVATGALRVAAGMDGAGVDATLTYAEHSGTSMAAPHVSGVLAGFLSTRPEYIGRPAEVKALLTGNATDLGRERFAQGAGLVDAMRMLSNS